MTSPDYQGPPPQFPQFYIIHNLPVNNTYLPASLEISLSGENWMCSLPKVQQHCLKLIWFWIKENTFILGCSFVATCFRNSWNTCFLPLLTFPLMLFPSVSIACRGQDPGEATKGVTLHRCSALPHLRCAAAWAESHPPWKAVGLLCIQEDTYYPPLPLAEIPGPLCSCHCTHNWPCSAQTFLLPLKSKINGLTFSPKSLLE